MTQMKKISFSLLLALLLLAGCNPFSFYAELDGESSLRILEDGTASDALTILPESAVIPVNVNYTFSASGGLEPYLFSVVEGTGSIGEETGIYTAPNVPGNARVRVTDSAGQRADAELNIIEPGKFTISPASITLYTYTTATFQGIGGIAPYTFSLVSGSGSINSETGFYTAPGNAGQDVVRVTDAQNNTSDASVMIYAPFRLAPASVNVTVNNSYTFTVTGGKTPYTFAVQSGTGTIDPLTGEYTAPGSTGTEVIEASDALGNTETATITVVPHASLVISPSSVTITDGDNYFFSATGGASPYTFSKISGPGSIDNLTGEYLSSGTGTAVIRVTDALFATSDAAVTVVAGGAVSIIPASAVIEQNDSLQFFGSGGSPPYTFTVFSGGGYITAGTGVYTAPTALDSATIRVTDSNGDHAESSVDIAPAAPTNFLADGAAAPANQDILLTWTDNASGEEGFELEYRNKTAGEAFGDNPSILLPADTVSYTAGPLNLNEVYGFRVRAYKSAVYSEYSEDSYDKSNY